MDKQKKTRGIVLRRMDLNDADQIVTVLTEDEGKLALVAKGSRRLKSKFCGRLEPFYHLDLNYYMGRDLGNLNEAEILDNFAPLELDLKSKSMLFYMAEITSRLVADGQECRGVYHLMKDCLEHFGEDSSEPLLLAYMVKLLTLLGFMAPWNVCSRTSEPINLLQPHYLSLRDTSVVKSGYAEGGDLRLTPSVIRWVSCMQKEDFGLLKRVRPSHGEQAEVTFIMQRVFGNIFSYPFKSESFLHAVCH